MRKLLAFAGNPLVLRVVGRSVPPAALGKTGE
jgi:hypothetical protein